MVTQITLQGKTYQYTSTSVSYKGKVIYTGNVTLAVLKAIAAILA